MSSIRPQPAACIFARLMAFGLWVLLMPCSFAADTPAALGDPAAPLAGKVAGMAVHATNGNELREIVMEQLLNRCALEKKVTVSKEEIAACREFMKKVAAEDRAEKAACRDQLKAKLSGGDLEKADREKTQAELAAVEQLLADTAPKDSPTDEEKAAMDEIAEAFIRQWKVNRLLHQEFGGRIIRQQGGPEPLDAHRRFLESAQKQGNLTITGESIEQRFWQYFRDDSLHDFYPAGSPEEAQAFNTPPWAAEKSAKSE
jgi:uncharacterized protein YjaG (DUF416 family)